MKDMQLCISKEGIGKIQAEILDHRGCLVSAVQHYLFIGVKLECQPLVSFCVDACYATAKSIVRLVTMPLTAVAIHVHHLMQNTLVWN